jgi:hypothetical protein
VLDDDHFGLEKPKRRIIEYLAVRKLKPDSKGPDPLLCRSSGNRQDIPGGSIARALGRKFHRISLGGVRDEAEIRGHRRTYVGALPGRIIQGLRRPDPTTPSSCSTKSTRWAAIFVATPLRPCWKCWTRSRTSPFRTTTWMCPSTCPR